MRTSVGNLSILSSDYLLAARLPKVTVNGTTKAMTQLLEPRRVAAQAIAWDNGSEFAERRQVAKAVQAKIYFMTRTAHASVTPMKILIV
ncbi:hypothetical protein QC815_06310 [Halomonas gomseomensis]|uniref:Transposase n=1 Tax=Vreelandella gomseomensis TaxID=370766 RepID=A0ABU1GBU5_9GAMM|nr:hypothetical protein [Halomonas gomseomensis]MDR5874534.1 hypothetical protein [Halomonas gomseomensis]